MPALYFDLRQASPPRRELAGVRSMDGCDAACQLRSPPLAAAVSRLTSPSSRADAERDWEGTSGPPPPVRHDGWCHRPAHMCLTRSQTPFIWPACESSRRPRLWSGTVHDMRRTSRPARPIRPLDVSHIRVWGTCPRASATSRVGCSTPGDEVCRGDHRIWKPTI